VLSDAPAGPGTPSGRSAIRSANAAPRSSRHPGSPGRAAEDFPGSLDGVSVLLPGSDSTFRRALNAWFQSHDIRPEIIAELDDLALASVMGRRGSGSSPPPDVIADELRQRYNVQLVGRAKEIQQRFYAISVERRSRTRPWSRSVQVARKHIFA